SIIVYFIFFYTTLLTPISILFPTRRSSDLIIIMNYILGPKMYLLQDIAKTKMKKSLIKKKEIILKAIKQTSTLTGKRSAQIFYYGAILLTSLARNREDNSN